MRFVVYGAGGIGGVMGARLHLSGHDVVLIARGAHYEAIRDNGLRLQSAEEDVVLPIPIVAHPRELDVRDDDVVCLAMKSQDTPGALEVLAACAPPEIAVVCVQNGVANERAALRYFPNVYGICVMCPTNYLTAGIVQAYSVPVTGIFDIGRYPDGVDDTAAAISQALSRSTYESVPRPDIMRWKYAKLLMNLGNSVQALCGNAARGGDFVRSVRQEGVAALEGAGIDFASRDEDAERRGQIMTMTPIGDQPRGGGSTWQSLERGLSAVETDYLNGEITLLGRLHGVPTPANALLQRLMAQAARERWATGTLTPDDLLAQLPAVPA